MTAPETAPAARFAAGVGGATVQPPTGPSHPDIAAVRRDHRDDGCGIALLAPAVLALGLVATTRTRRVRAGCSPVVALASLIGRGMRGRRT